MSTRSNKACSSTAPKRLGKKLLMLLQLLLPPLTCEHLSLEPARRQLQPLCKAKHTTIPAPTKTRSPVPVATGLGQAAAAAACLESSAPLSLRSATNSTPTSATKCASKRRTLMPVHQGSGRRCAALSRGHPANTRRKSKHAAPSSRRTPQNHVRHAAIISPLAAIISPFTCQHLSGSRIQVLPSRRCVANQQPWDIAYALQPQVHRTGA